MRHKWVVHIPMSYDLHAFLGPQGGWATLIGARVFHSKKAAQKAIDYCRQYKQPAHLRAMSIIRYEKAMLLDVLNG